MCDKRYKHFTVFLHRTFVDTWESDCSPGICIRIFFHIGLHNLYNFRDKAGHNSTAIPDLRSTPTCSKGSAAVKKLITQDVKSIKNFLEDFIYIVPG